MFYRKLYISFSLLFFIMVMGTVGYYILFDGKTRLLDCLYMTIITLSTVGYGEVIDIAHNDAAKVFTMVLMVSGIGLLFYNFSLMTAFMVEGELSEIWRRRWMKRKISTLKDHYIICGIGETGLYVLEEFLKVGVPLVLVENDPERLEKCRQQGDLLYITGDCTDDEVLIEAGIERAQGIVAALPADKDNLFITVTARQMNPKIRIVAKGAVKMKNKLLKAGANAVVCPQSIGGLRMASEMIRPSVVSFLDLMLRDTQKTIRIEEIFIKEGSSLAGKTLLASSLKDKFNLLVLSTVNKGKVVYNPPADTVLEPGITLIVLGNNREVREAQELARGQQ